MVGIAESEREGTRAETRIGLSAKRTSPFKSAGVSVQSTTGSRGVRISRQDYWLPTPFASFPFTSLPVRHRVPSHSDSALQHARTVTPIASRLYEAVEVEGILTTNTTSTTRRLPGRDVDGTATISAPRYQPTAKVERAVVTTTHAH